MPKNILKHFISGLILFVIFAPLLGLAQGGTNPQPVSMNIKIENPFKQDTLKGLIETIINDILIPVGAVVAVLMIMYAGFMYVTARGDSAQIKKAHDALLSAVIGAAILLGAWVISQAIDATISQLKV